MSSALELYALTFNCAVLAGVGFALGAGTIIKIYLLCDRKASTTQQEPVAIATPTTDCEEKCKTNSIKHTE